MVGASELLDGLFIGDREGEVAVFDFVLIGLGGNKGHMLAVEFDGLADFAVEFQIELPVMESNPLV